MGSAIIVGIFDTYIVSFPETEVFTVLNDNNIRILAPDDGKSIVCRSVINNDDTYRKSLLLLGQTVQNAPDPLGPVVGDYNTKSIHNVTSNIGIFCRYHKSGYYLVLKDSYICNSDGVEMVVKWLRVTFLFNRIFLMAKKVFVSGCYDLLHSGHVEFFRQASQYGDLYVGIGSDATVLHYKNHKTLYPEQERLFMVKSIKYVKDAFINAGDGVMDFIPTVEALKPDVFVVNADGSTEEKRRFCEERGIEYVVLQRTPAEGLKVRSSTDLKAETCRIPTRLDLAGTWIDQPYVSYLAPGWAITISLEPTFDIRDRCGLSTSTRNMIRKIWPVKLPDMEPEMLAKLVYCFENDPERSDGVISGAQDAIGICVPGLSRHYYNNRFWPEKIETCEDPQVLDWLEKHLVLIPIEPRRPGCSVVEGKDITLPKVKALAAAADRCWESILAMDLDRFAAAYRDSFDAQVAMFPGMLRPVYFGSPAAECHSERSEESIPSIIAHWAAVPGVLAWKMPGAGGGGYLALVVEDAESFSSGHPEAIRLSIRRSK